MWQKVRAPSYDVGAVGVDANAGVTRRFGRAAAPATRRGAASGHAGGAVDGGCGGSHPLVVCILGGPWDSTKMLVVGNMLVLMHDERGGERDVPGGRELARRTT